MKIHIIENDPIYLSKLQREINSILVKQHLDWTLETVSTTAHGIIDKLDWTSRNLFFIDINLEDNYSGIHFARDIRKQDNMAKIVFLTGYPEFTFSVFQHNIEALDYIIKGMGGITQRIEKCMLIAGKRLQKSEEKQDYFTFFQGKDVIRIQLSDLYYIETSRDRIHKNYLIVNARNRRFKVRGSIKDFEGIYPAVVKCHQSFLVNVNNAISFDKEKRVLTMQNQEEIAVSKRGITILSELLPEKILEYTPQ